MKRYLRIFLMPAIAAVVATFLFLGEDGVRARAVFKAMNTDVKVIVYSNGKAGCKAAFMNVESRIKELESLFDVHREDTVAAKVNEAAGGEPVKVPWDFIRCLKSARELCEKSGGALDVTVRPLLMVWKNAAMSSRPPTDEEIAAARKLVDFRKIAIDENRSTVALAEPGMMLDLGAVAKGFIVDECIRTLKQSGIESALVEAGGDIRALGSKPGGEKWFLSIRDPRKPQSTAGLETTEEQVNNSIYLVHALDRAVTTSGNYERFFEIEGERHSHIVDPRTGMTADAVPSATVIAPLCVTADGLSTALSVMGAKEGLELVESMPGVEALIVTIDRNGEAETLFSSGFKEAAGK